MQYIHLYQTSSHNLTLRSKIHTLVTKNGEKTTTQTGILGRLVLHTISIVC